MYPCPRLVFEQIDFTSKITGVTGIKEYYGICTKYMSVNESVMGECFNGKTNFDEIISAITDKYTVDQESKHNLLEYWSFSSRVLELLPWEVSWVLRFSNYHPYDESYWGKVSFANLPKTPWNTPSWLSNRRSYYMVSDNTHNMNRDYCSDIIKRFNFCTDLIDEGLKFAEKTAVTESYNFIMKTQKESSLLLKSLIKCRLNHLLLSLEMEHLRNGESVLSFIFKLLNDEKENALYLIDLVQKSEIPYMISTEIINRGIISIDEFIDDVKKGENFVLNKHINF
jgi:hypothetical protein